jgi:hypothetical protein
MRRKAKASPSSSLNVLRPPRTWTELHGKLWRKSVDPVSGEYRPRIAFRGMPNNYGNLKTGIQRITPDRNYKASTLGFLERRIIDTFRTYAHEQLPGGCSDWDVLLLGQHHRLPTRLLDWTASPYVALFFVTENPELDEKDGIVWCVSRHDTNDLLSGALKACVESQSGQLVSLQTLKKQFPEGLDDLDNCLESGILWFEPPSVASRIVNQYAFFSVMPRVEALQCEWLSLHPTLHWGVPVPAGLKKEIRRRLQVMNITDRTIYGGLEGIARWLRGYYSGWKG